MLPTTHSAPNIDSSNLPQTRLNNESNALHSLVTDAETLRDRARAAAQMVFRMDLMILHEPDYSGDMQVCS